MFFSKFLSYNSVDLTTVVTNKYISSDQDKFLQRMNKQPYMLITIIFMVKCHFSQIFYEKN